MSLLQQGTGNKVDTCPAVKNGDACNLNESARIGYMGGEPNQLQQSVNAIRSECSNTSTMQCKCRRGTSTRTNRMKKVAVALLFVLGSGAAHAGDAENIQACIKKAAEFAGVRLSEFDVSYQGNILSMSKATWKNAYCEVKLGEVYNLKVNGKEVVYNGYAGRDSYELKKALEERTDRAIGQLNARISILEQRMSQATTSLRNAKPDHAQLSRYIDEGIAKAVSSPSAAVESATPSPERSGAPASAPEVSQRPQDVRPLASDTANRPDSRPEQHTTTPSSRDVGREALWVERGKDAVRAKLKDPSSATFRGEYFRRGADNVPIACGHVNSKNSFGGYKGYQRFVSAGKPELTFLEEEVADFEVVWNRLCQ